MAKFSRLDLVIGSWARISGLAEKKDDLSVYTEWLDQESRRLHVPKVVLAAAWAGGSLAVMVTLPIVERVIGARLGVEMLMDFTLSKRGDKAVKRDGH